MAKLSTIHRGWIAAALFVLSLCAYLYNYRYRIWSAGGDTTPAELLPLALERNHSLYFDGLEEPGSWWFYRLNGHLVSGYPIVPGFFNVPAYAIARWQGVPLDSMHRSMLSMVSASFVVATSVVVFFLAVSRMVTRRSIAIGATILYAMGTTAMSVAARGMWQHGPSLLFITIGLWLFARGDRVSIALAGLPLGFAVFNRPMNLLLVAPLALYVLWSHRRVFLPFCAVAAIPAALMAWYSYHYWGTVTTLGQYPAGNWFLGHFFAGVAGLFFSPSRGLLIFTPPFLFSILMLFAVLARPLRDPLLTAMSLGIVATITVYAKWYSWWGGYSFGYRLLTELVPFLAILLAVGWERYFMKARPNYAILAIAALFAFYVHFLGAFFAPCGFDWIPNSIDQHPERLWSWTDGELARCTDRFAERIQSHF